MHALNQLGAVLRRPISTSGHYDASGRYVNNGPSYLIRQIRGSLQPLPKHSRKQLLEQSGWRLSDCRMFYTRCDLFPADNFTELQSDVIIFKGVEYEVMQSDPWIALHRLSHNRVLLKRIDKTKELFNSQSS